MRPLEVALSTTRPDDLDHHGGVRVRGIAEVPRSSTDTGRFGRMFRTLEPLHLSDEVLTALAGRMTEAAAGTPGGWSGIPTPQDNSAVPAGYTYLAQFVDHDITFDPVSSLDRSNDPNALENYRTPRYDLDSVYGGGPLASRHLYDVDDPDKLLVGQNPSGGFEPVDLPRNQQGVALVGDPRNDVHVIIGQLHLQFLRAHNATVERVRGDSALRRGAESVLDSAQRLMRWHYQWIVVTELLPRIVGPETADAVLLRDANGRLRASLALYSPRRRAFMPIEHSAAAYRFGHSMIRPSYQLNSDRPAVPIFSTAGDTEPTADLRGFRRLPVGWTVAWNLFFPGLDNDSGAQPSRLIDTHIADPLASLPPRIDGQRRSLALLNLFRGDRLGLPAGDAVATALAGKTGIGNPPLSPTELGLDHPAPLWFYLLKEAELRANGQHLGPVGGRIVAEVLVGLLQNDPASFLRVDPAWKPILPSREPGAFTVADLIRLATPV